MGQQQLLLIVLGVIVVGIAVVVGINLFNANSESSNRDAVISDLTNLGSMAQQYYKKPLSMAGGGNSFKNWKIPTSLATTANGTYSIKGTGNTTKIVLTGTGTSIGKKGTGKVEVTTTVTPTSIKSVVIN